jgi:acyl-CoA thioester hydrolase
MSHYGAPFVGAIKTVEPEWIDYNGHFNMAYYAVLFDRTADEAFELVGLGPDYVQSRNASYFTLEATSDLCPRARRGRSRQGHRADPRP